MIHDEKMNTPHLVILGNPEIGKTFFGYVSLLFPARDSAVVVYESGRLKQRYLFTNNMVVEGAQNDFFQIPKNPETYYIVDAVNPPDHAAKTIILTSPRRSIWWEFNKTTCDTLYMPVWTWKEIFHCRELLFHNLALSMVSNHFRRWGEGEWDDEGKDDDDDMDVGDNAMEDNPTVTWDIGDAIRELELLKQPTTVFNGNEDVQDAGLSGPHKAFGGPHLAPILERVYQRSQPIELILVGLSQTALKCFLSQYKVNALVRPRLEPAVPIYLNLARRAFAIVRAIPERFLPQTTQTLAYSNWPLVVGRKYNTAVDIAHQEVETSNASTTRIYVEI
ncbi:unnamed protein product [Phytophthora lilii]|uniref:Unnamed protein product n=1 Tax=Phytophthora lilii TaxID=2077276 RepID=A0A9W6TJU8_9STRA|nr:unnamed protein product [Phytophthora lilii]